MAASISVKLVLATAVVVAAAIGTAAWFSSSAIDEVTAAHVEELRATGETSIARESERLVKALANALALPVSTSQTADALGQLDQALEEDTARRIQWLVVTLPGSATPGAIVTWSDPATLAERRGRRQSTAAAVPTTRHQLAPIAARLGRADERGVASARTGTDWVYRTPIAMGATVVGELWMGVTTKELEAALAASLDEARAAAAAKRNRLLALSLLVLALGIALAIVQGVRLTRPIRALTAQAHRLGGGDFSIRVPEDRGDELGVLARTFNGMTDKIRGLLDAQAKQIAMSREMELAREVQQAMLPPQTLDEHGGVQLAGYCVPASSCGGDWWMYRKLSGDRLLLVIGDATGHGIHSAMIAATARGAVEALSAITGVDERGVTPDHVLRAIDAAIRQVGDHSIIMTAFAAVFEAGGRMHYANAGQNFPYVLKLDERTGKLTGASIIAASGNPLGDRQIAVEIRRGTMQLAPGDLFVCFTDGVVERSDPDGKLFGDRALRNALLGQPLANGQALLALRDRVVEALDRHAAGRVADDDVTLVLCQYRSAA